VKVVLRVGLIPHSKNNVEKVYESGGTRGCKDQHTSCLDVYVFCSGYRMAQALFQELKLERVEVLIFLNYTLVSVHLLVNYFCLVYSHYQTFLIF